MQSFMASSTVFFRKLAILAVGSNSRNSITDIYLTSSNHKANKMHCSSSTPNTVCTDNSSKDIQHQLPIYACGEIVRGFGRGSKELGIPTANLALEVVKSLPTGVYYGWANVSNGEVHKMVLSVGWNPFYNNKEKSVETHILHDFKCDLYGNILKLCIVGYLRPEQNFNSLDDLIKVIKSDIEQAKLLLDKPENFKLREANFFTEEIKC